MRERMVTARPWLFTVARLALAGVFIYAGWPKLVDPDGTARSIRAYRLLPEFAVQPLAYALPVFELALALLLILGLGTRAVALITAAVLAMFAVAVGTAWARGLNIDCGCFGNVQDAIDNPARTYGTHILGNLAGTAIAACMARWPYSRFSLDAVLGVTAPSSPGADVPAHS
jgi:uncharacterized membrane protein YphA (DoxX/SURF4 family)